MPSYTVRTLLTLLLCLLVTVPAAAQSKGPSGPMWSESPKAQIPADIARLNNHMNSVIEQLKPVLVQIRVRRAQEPPAEGETPSTPEERRISGSGFIIRKDGYVVTEAERIQVKLSDGRRLDGKVIGQDDRVDLALVKIEATGLPVAMLGDSNRLRVGEFVLAVSNPFGLEQTVSL